MSNNSDLIAPCLERIASAGVAADGIVERLPSIRRRVATNIARAAAARWLQRTLRGTHGSPTDGTAPCPHALQARTLVYESAGCAQSLERILLQLDGVAAPDTASGEERAVLRAHRRAMVLHIQDCISACDSSKAIAERGLRLVTALLGPGLDKRPWGARAPGAAATAAAVSPPPAKLARPSTPIGATANANALPTPTPTATEGGLSSACGASHGFAVPPVPVPVPAPAPATLQSSPMPPLPRLLLQVPEQQLAPVVSPLPLPGTSPLCGPRARCVPCTHSLKWKTARRRQRRQASGRSVTPIQWRTCFHQPAAVK
jgi:hypothetical protein